MVLCAQYQCAYIIRITKETSGLERFTSTLEELEGRANKKRAAAVPKLEEGAPLLLQLRI